VICNSSGGEQSEKEILADFAQVLGSKLVHFIPRSPVIQSCEVENRSVLEHSPQSEEAEVFRKLAQEVMDNDRPVIPTPVMELAELEALYRSHLRN